MYVLIFIEPIIFLSFIGWSTGIKNKRLFINNEAFICADIPKLVGKVNDRV